ncbi:Ctf8-domain-containing protein [Auriculariales sp. MPI-PUGE-AT-0066]|nr:Ctf8-domain-containing protein [Auriculariales sp. MPI-PUGE-AT-0066]
MRIPVNLTLPTSSADSGQPLPPQLVKLGSGEVAIIELQGSLQLGADVPAQGEFVGTLSFDANDKPMLSIGAHALEGKVVSIPKPLALLKRTRLVDPEDISANPRTDTHYDTVAIVRKKLVFSKRPMPIPTTLSLS